MVVRTGMRYDSWTCFSPSPARSAGSFHSWRRRDGSQGHLHSCTARHTTVPVIRMPSASIYLLPCPLPVQGSGHSGQRGQPRSWSCTRHPTPTCAVGVMRMLGMTRGNVMQLVLTQAYFYAIPAWVIGLLGAQGAMAGLVSMLEKTLLLDLSSRYTLCPHQLPYPWTPRDPTPAQPGGSGCVSASFGGCAS